MILFTRIIIFILKRGGGGKNGLRWDKKKGFLMGSRKKFCRWAMDGKCNDIPSPCTGKKGLQHNSSLELAEKYSRP
jgi:hypothetical protein